MGAVPDDAVPATRKAAAGEAHAQVVVPLGTPLAEAERALILATLRHCGGVRKRAAEMLGISLKTLYNRLVRYGRGAAAGCGGR
jgi:DNA-binding NtrC family response regulator